MADFCKQCSELMFGDDFGDLAGLESAQKWGKTVVICEGCGMIYVDGDGKCLNHTDRQHEDAILRGISPKDTTDASK